MEEECAPSTLRDDVRFSVWDNIPLYIWRWIPSGSVRGIVYLSHGIGEYLGRYEKLAQVLSDSGLLVVGHDHVGHGKSGGEREYIEDFSVYVRDVINHIHALKSAYPGVPIYLLGHSMGGLIAILTAALIQDELDGLILSAAGIELTANAAGPFERIGIRIAAVITPRLQLKKLDPGLVSSIQEEVKEYSADPLVYHEGVKPKMISELLNSMSPAKEKVANLTKPVFIMHGGDDDIVPISASEFIHSHIGSEDKKFERFDGNFHEVLHDKDQERARMAIKTWVLSHIES